MLGFRRDLKNAARARATVAIVAAIVCPTPAIALAETAVAPATAESPPTLAGYVPGEGFILRSADDAYRLRVGLQAAYRVEPRYDNGVSQDREMILSTRPTLEGTVFRPWIGFRATAELAANPPFLLFSYLDIHPVKAFGIRLGQQDTPFSRHESFGLYWVLFPETGPVPDYFWTGRDKGATVYGSVADGRLDYYAGFYGASPLRQFTTIAGNYIVEGRLTASPLGPIGASEFAYALGDGPAPTRISFTLQGYFGRVQTATENFDPNTFLYQAMPTGMTNREQAGGADLFVQSSRVIFFSEAYVRRTEPVDGSPSFVSAGAWAQLSVLLVPRWLDAAVRASWCDPATHIDDDRLLGGEGQLTWYISAPTLIAKLRYAYLDQQSPGTAALGEVELPVSPGHSQVMTLQANLSF